MRQPGFVHEEFLNRLKLFQKKMKMTGKAMAEAAGISKQSFSGYRSGSIPSAPVLTAWSTKFDLNVDWLLTGEGEMFRNGKSAGAPGGLAAMPFKTPPPRMIPVIGLAACATEGWFNPGPLAMDLPMPVDYAPEADLFAVVAVGTSMQPAGITQGNVLICDPGVEPRPNDTVFVQQRDGLAAIKRFLKKDDKWMYLTGWLPPDKTGHQKSFNETRLLETLSRVACVVVVKLRA